MTSTPPTSEALLSTMDQLIPQPVFTSPTGDTFTLTPQSAIYVNPSPGEVANIAHYLADKLKSSTGYDIRVLPIPETTEAGGIYLTTSEDPALGDEGYELSITPDTVTLTAPHPAGLFWGVQTIRQLLPSAIESATPQTVPWKMPTGAIRDYPRFSWRGAMLDVSRHFFGVEDVKSYIDALAYYKINRLHLHLSDDQGWRIMIQSWPKLATHGGSTEVGGGPGGYYTQAEYAEIVAYAQGRYIMVIPEIDMPGHTNAALASYPELNCDGVSPPLYTGTEVGFSSLCIEKELTFSFVDDVIKEIAALTPGPYIHIGGDEAKATNKADYAYFIERVQGIIQSYDKQMIGWEEISQSQLHEGTIVQHWFSSFAKDAVEQGAKVIMSPSTKAYLDMKYDESTPLGLDWAGFTDVQDAYTWDPASQVEGVSEGDVLGVEAPLWAETLQTSADVEVMAFPRLLGYAEIGWSASTGRDWEEYRIRLAAHGPRLTAMGVNFYHSPLVSWPID